MSLLKFRIIRGDFSDHSIQTRTSCPSLIRSILFTLLYASLFFFIAIITACHFIYLSLQLFIVCLLKIEYKLQEVRALDGVILLFCYVVDD